VARVLGGYIYSRVSCNHMVSIECGEAEWLSETHVMGTMTW
jgi:hypothetical protein